MMMKNPWIAPVVVGLLLAGIGAALNALPKSDAKPKPAAPAAERPGDCYVENAYPISRVEASIRAGEWLHVPKYSPQRLRVARLVSDGRAVVGLLDIVCGDPVAGTSAPQRVWYWRCVDKAGCE